MFKVCRMRRRLDVLRFRLDFGFARRYWPVRCLGVGNPGTGLPCWLPDDNPVLLGANGLALRQHLACCRRPGAGIGVRWHRHRIGGRAPWRLLLPISFWKVSVPGLYLIRQAVI
jgi:hypothetical protein